MRMALVRFRAATALLSLSLALSAQAGIKTTSVIVTGSGASEEEATAAALAKAVAETKGVRASTNVSTGKLAIEGHRKSSVDGRASTVDVDTRVGTTPDVRMQSAGRVSRYEVQSSRREEGLYKVTLKAFFDTHVADVYKAPGSGASKSRIAVLMPKWSGTAADEGQGGYSASEAAGRLRNGLERALLRGGTYSILDRQTLDSSLAELQLVDSDLTSAAEKSKLRNLRGADIILIPTLRFSDTLRAARGAHLTGQRASASSDIEIEVRAVVPATAEVVFDESYRIEDVASSDDAVIRVASQAANDLNVRLTGKAPKTSNADMVYLRSDNVPPPLPPDESSGVKLPFDR